MDPREFWDKKILKWEKDKYEKRTSRLLPLDVNSSVKARMAKAREFLRGIVKGKSVLELGCGSAFLMKDILEAGATSYKGIDVSPVAIEAAKIKAKNEGLGSRVELIEMDIRHLPAVNTDICFSLGVFDWLELNELQDALKKIDCTGYLHSFSEKRNTLDQLAHRLYVFGMYGRKDRTYVPRYYSTEDLEVLFASANKMPPKIYRHQSLRFGSFA